MQTNKCASDEIFIPTQISKNKSSTNEINEEYFLFDATAHIQIMKPFEKFPLILLIYKQTHR
jgi:hypothetical protein